MIKTKENLVGQTFERLTVIEQAEDYVDPSGKHYARWLCECNCNERNRIVVAGKSLKSGLTKSCGCLKKEMASRRSSSNTEINLVDFDSEEYAIGYTLKGEPFWFDKEDYAKIKNYCWFYDKKGYVTATERKTKKTIFLHVLVMDPVPDGMIVDHKQHPPRNEHKINNQKSNLEIKTQSQNMMNMSLPLNNTSGNKGVSWNKQLQKWRAYIGIDKNQIHLGYFINKQDAISARKQAEEKYFGKYSYDANNS